MWFNKTFIEQNMKIQQEKRLAFVRCDTNYFKTETNYAAVFKGSSSLE